MENDKKMTGLILETENLVKALASLKKEIESYEVAKNNLVEVKEKLVEVNESSLDISKQLSQYTKELHNLVNSDLVRKVDNIIENNNTIMLDLKKSFKLTYIILGVSVILNIVFFIMLYLK